MHIVFLRFGPNRAQAGRWMAEHGQWIQQGIDDGVFLMAGSLEGGQGGAVLAVGLDGSALQARVQQDPFVAHGVAVPEVHGIAPSRLAPAWAGLLGGASAAPPAA